MLAPDVPTTVLQYLLLDEQDGEDLDLQKARSFYIVWEVISFSLLFSLMKERFNQEISCYIFFQIDKEQAELMHANFSTLRKEAQAILDLVGINFDSQQCFIISKKIKWILMDNEVLIRSGFIGGTGYRLSLVGLIPCY